MEFSLILPAYNEEKVIAQTLNEAIRYLDVKFKDYEIIVVDDGSTDNTVAEVKEVDHPRVVLLVNKWNLGKGASVKKGMLHATGELVLFMDADHSTNISHLDLFIRELLSERADIVIGSRALSDSNIVVHQRQAKEKIGKIGNSLIRKILKMNYSDTQCGFKLFNRRSIGLFKKQKLDGWGFDFEILFLAEKAGLKILELPVSWKNNFQSKVRPFDYVKTLVELFKVKYYYLNKRYETKN